MIHHTNGHTPRSFADILHRVPDAETVQEMRELVHNFQYLRSRFVKDLTDPRRDLNKECGYPDQITVQMYQDAYERNPVAKRVVEFLPKECWAVTPEVYEDEDGNTTTPFETAVAELERSLRGDQNWHDGQDGSMLSSYLQEAHIKARIGSYGVIFLGLDDGLSPDQPVQGLTEEYSVSSTEETALIPGIPGIYTLNVNARAKKGRKLLFIRCYPEVAAQITRRERNYTSPRYCHPLEYQIVTADGTLKVHWSRVVHISEGDVYHAPPLRAVFDHVLDAKKVYGSDAEAYWKSALMKMFFETPAQFGGDVDVNIDEIKDMMEQFANGLQPWGVLKGLNAHPVGPSVVDPRSHIDVAIEGICIEGGYPKRVFMGSEVGDLASSQDRKTHQERIQGVRTRVCTPRLASPLYNRLILVGVLPEPAQYYVNWPQAEVLSEQEKNSAALTRAQALTQCDQQKSHSRMDFLTRVMGYDEHEAETIIANRDKEDEEKQKKALEQQQQMIAQGLAPDPTAQPTQGDAAKEKPKDAAPAGDAGVVNFTSNFDPNQDRDNRGRWTDGGGGGGTGPTAPPHARAKAASLLSSAASLAGKGAWASAKVAAGTVKVAAKVMKKGLEIAYHRYGNKGSIATYIVAHTLFSGASVVTGGGAALAGAALFGLASVEVRNAIAGFLGIVGGEDKPYAREMAGKGITGNAGDAQGLPAFVLDFLEDFAEAAGLPPPKLSVEQVEKLIAEALGKEPTDNADCGTGAGGFKPGNTCAKGDGTTSQDDAGVVSRIKAKVQAKFDTLTGRYGRKGAIAVMAGMAAMAPVPVPGAVLLPVGVAEGILAAVKTTRHLTSNMEEIDEETADLIAEILYGLFGEDALSLLGLTANAWDPLEHPRGKGGRFVVKGSAEAVSQAKEAVSQVLREGRSPGGAKAVLEHLSNLTVQQIRDVAKEHGRKVPKMLRDEMVSAIVQLVGKGAPEVKAEPHEMTRSQYMATGGVGLPEDHPLRRQADSTRAELRNATQELLQAAGMYKRNKMDLDTRKSTIGAAMEFTPHTIETALKSTRVPRDVKDRYRTAKAQHQAASDAIDEAGDHETHVKAALAAGKPVPPEVLADYPDLQAKTPDAPRTSAADKFATLTPAAKPVAQTMADAIEKVKAGTETAEFVSLEFAQAFNGLSAKNKATVLDALGIPGEKTDLSFNRFRKHVWEIRLQYNEKRRAADLERKRAAYKDEKQWREHPSVAALGDRLQVLDDARDDDVQRNLEHVSRFPAHVLQDLADKGVTIQVGARPVTEFPGAEYLRGERPRGWIGEGKTWDNVAGVYRAKDRTVVIGKGEAYDLMAPHEIGHAIGFTTGLQDHPEFLAFHSQNFDKLIPYEQQGGRAQGFATSGAQEYFADIVGEYVGNGPAAARAAYGQSVVDWIERQVFTR